MTLVRTEALLRLGLVALHQEEFELATTHFQEGLAAARRIGAKLDFAQLPEGLAAVLCQQGHSKMRNLP